MEEGRPDGKTVGDILGPSDGALEGKALDNSEGLPLGDPLLDGRLEGVVDGSKLPLGCSLELSLGSSLRETEGLPLGVSEGRLYGNSVGL